MTARTSRAVIDIKILMVILQTRSPSRLLMPPNPYSWLDEDGARHKADKGSIIYRDPIEIMAKYPKSLEQFI